ncbi:MAG: ADP-ribosyltransferase [Gemmatimonadaceae bacterium]
MPELTVGAWLEMIQEAWKEQDHPRGFGGKFGSGTGTAKTPSSGSGTSGGTSAPAGKAAPKKAAAKPKTVAPKTAATKKPATKKTSAAPGPPPPAKDKGWQDDHYSDYQGALTPAQKRAISGYQGADYGIMQAQLRAGDLNDADRKRAATANRNLVAAIGKAPPTTEPMTVHRTMPASMAAGLEPGGVMGDLGFVSASLTPKKTSRGATVEIALPEGVKAAVGENGEMVLPASGKFRVLSVEDKDGSPHVRMEFVPRGSTKAKPAPAATPEPAPKTPAKDKAPPPAKAATPPEKPPAKAATPKKAAPSKAASKAAPPEAPAKDKQFLDDHYGEWRDNLNSAQDKAMRFYQSPGYALMNGQLRGLDKADIKADVSFNDSDLARAAKASKDLTAAIKKSPPLTEPMTVYRGFSADQFGDLTPGQMVTDKGFVSTSITPDVGAVGKASRPATAEIVLPVGAKAAAGTTREMVLPPNSQFKVISVEDRGGVPHVRMELVTKPALKAKAKATPEPAKAEPEAPTKAAGEAPAKPKTKAVPAPDPTSGMNGATRHTSDDDGAKWLNKKMPNPKRAPFTAADRKALRAYTGETYTNINEALRNPDKRRDPDVQADIDGIDASMAKSVLPEDVIVHRGVGGDFAARLGANIKDPESMRAMIGKVSVEDSYLSTSAGQQAAFGRDIQLMMRVPKGARAVNVMPISQSPNERELLLDRGMTWVVHDAYEAKGSWHVEVEAVPKGWQPGPDWKPSSAGDADSGYTAIPSADTDNVDDLYLQDMIDQGFEV